MNINLKIATKLFTEQNYKKCIFYYIVNACSVINLLSQH